jgi:hypothetical protein
VKDQLFWLVDIDGTLALRDELRGPFDWHLVMGDRPNQPVVDVVVALSQAGFQIIYISGRPDSTMEVTSKWLDENVGVAGLIFMRSENDYRSDDIVKAEIFENKIFQRFAIRGVIDDRNKVVKMWREKFGLTCLQVAAGNF